MKSRLLISFLSITIIGLVPMGTTSCSNGGSYASSKDIMYLKRQFFIWLVKNAHLIANKISNFPHCPDNWEDYPNEGIHDQYKSATTQLGYITTYDAQSQTQDELVYDAVCQEREYNIYAGGWQEWETIDAPILTDDSLSYVVKDINQDGSQDIYFEIKPPSSLAWAIFMDNENLVDDVYFTLLSS
jgi:hypothetical protein